jgi:hypothetical protein
VDAAFVVARYPKPDAPPPPPSGEVTIAVPRAGTYVLRP